LKLRKEEVKTWQKSFRMSSSKCRLMRCRVSPMCTIVNSEMTLKLTRLSSGPARRDLMVLMNSMEAARTSEMLVNFCQSTRHYNPEDGHLHRFVAFI
jgi:hypothetical protein